MPSPGSTKEKSPDQEWHTLSDGAPEIIRIPLRLPPGELPVIDPKDVILHPGDIVLVPSRDPEVFYTGGLMPTGEYPLPRDYDLTVVDAIVQVGAPFLNGGFNIDNLEGAVVERGLGGPSPRLISIVRRSPDGAQNVIVVDLFRALRDPQENILVKSGDLLVLQETKTQAFGRYTYQVFNLGIFTEIFRSGSATGVGALNLLETGPPFVPFIP